MKVFLFTIFFSLTSVLFGQVTGPEQDCGGAIPVCFNLYNQPLSYSGPGAIDDLNKTSRCLQNDENNSVWYIFTVTLSGNLEFVINPNNSGPNGDDYDFSLFNITDGSCSDIANGTANEVRCNYAFTNGPTGLKTGYTGTVSGPGDSAFLAPLPVVAGETFALVVDNFSSTSNGYTLDFNPSSASIVDFTPPEVSFVDSLDCDNTSNIFLTFTEPVICDSIDMSGGGFIVVDPLNNVVPITGILSADCITGSFTTNAVITLANPVTLGGIYKLVSLDSALTDNCTRKSIRDTVEFFVPDIVSAGFTHTVRSSCVADTFSFQNQSTGNYDSTSVLWDFGDGNTATVQNPVHLYSDIGVYTVELSVSSAHCTDTYVDNNIVVTNSFLPRIEWSPENPCAGDTIFFRDASHSTATVWFWNFGDTNISGQQDPWHIYRAPGFYTVEFLMQDQLLNCASDTLRTIVRIRERPNADFVYDGVACENDPLTLRDTSAGSPAGWLWDFGDGQTSTVQNPVHTFLSTGLFDLQLTIVDSFCSPGDDIIKPIMVLNRPVFDLGEDTSACVSEAVILVAYPEADQYLWSTGETTPFIEFDKVPGAVWAIAHLDGCQYADTVFVGKRDLAECSDIWVPKAFTPNYDGKNDVLRVFSKRVEEYEITIFNRWGEKIITFGNTDLGWDGSYKDEMQNMGTYTYILEWKAIGGGKFTKTGTVTLIR